MCSNPDSLALSSAMSLHSQAVTEPVTPVLEGGQSTKIT